MTTDQSLMSTSLAVVPPAVVPATWVAIDIAKDLHEVLIESNGKRQQHKLPNTLESMTQFHASARPATASTYWV